MPLMHITFSGSGGREGEEPPLAGEAAMATRWGGWRRKKSHLQREEAAMATRQGKGKGEEPR
jgi:hypothetical protein